MSDDFVLCVRNKKGQKFEAEPGPPTFLRIPSSGEIVPRFEVKRDDWFRAVLKEAKAFTAEAPTDFEGDVLLFVHGYAADPATALRRHRLIKKDLGAVGSKAVVISFDWPSDSTVFNYVEDRLDARETALHLVSDLAIPFARARTRDCRINAHILGHSTGVFVIREAFAAAAEYVGPGYDWAVSQLLFIGGDVSASSLSAGDRGSRNMYDRAVRVTNYSNPHDWVLKLSNAKRIGLSPRAGRIGLPTDAPEKAVDVDCGSYFTTLKEAEAEYMGTFAHAWHIGDPVFALDLHHAIEGDLDRNVFPTRKKESDGRLILRQPLA